jgi:hypothetical protein
MNNTQLKIKKFTENELAQLLRKAYEAGWYGSLDLQESFVAEAIQESFKDVKLESEQFSDYNFHTFLPISSYSLPWVTSQGSNAIEDPNLFFNQSTFDNISHSYIVQ